MPLPSRPARRRLALPLIAALALPAAACVWVFNSTRVKGLARPGPSDSVSVATSVKVHLLDGSVVLLPNGVVLVRDTLRGVGTRWDLSLVQAEMARVSVPLDSVLGMETFQPHVDAGSTAIVSTLATALGTVGAAGLIVAISCIDNPKCFGSCPTFYSDSAGRPVLEAEGFSYSIAPLFEARDVDRLRVTASRDGDVQLEVRDEALETHYINSLSLLEVLHARDELVLPDQYGRPLAVQDLAPAASARDRAGRDVASTLARADGEAYRTDPSVIDGATAQDLNDDLDLAFPVPAGADSVALVFRMRNSLLNTVLLYDVMLADPGLKSVEWLARDLQEVGPAAQLGRWYVEHMGMSVATREGGVYREVSRIADTGPVAWKDVAVIVPVPRGDSLRVRLTFVADDWRIDQVRVASVFRHAAGRPLPPAAVLGRDDRPDTTALAALSQTDGRYLQTGPGERFTIRFAAGPGPAAGARTFLLVSQGYYTEWVRGAWLKSAAYGATAFAPSDEALLTTLRRWRREQPDLERRFALTRVPVR